MIQASQLGDSEKAQGLQALAALADDPSSVRKTHPRQLTTDFNRLQLQ